MSLAHRVAAMLAPSPRRVVCRLFLPGEEMPGGRSRADGIVQRVMAVPDCEVAPLVHRLLRDFDGRHPDLVGQLRANADVAWSHVRPARVVSADRELLMGACFTAEYAVEAAALCNPSAVLHPDQRGMADGQARVAMSVRGIGEGHVSSVGFAVAVVGPGDRWEFEDRQLPLATGGYQPATWTLSQLRAVLAEHGHVNELSYGVLSALPDTFTGHDLQTALSALPRSIADREGARDAAELLRRLVASSYSVRFAQETSLSQRVLMPAADDERNGIEDVRLVRFTDATDVVGYRGTYTAYDGARLAPRLLVSEDLATFTSQRLGGPAARNKGMALFPRLVGGRYLALCRSDGESSTIASSEDGLVWGQPMALQHPGRPAELLQVGNCGSPIETPTGWLVLTHGVGPLRVYSIGAILLDLEQPHHVIGRLASPLLVPHAAEQDGYVPNVVYSCGGLVHGGRLWIPYGVGDSRIHVAWIDLAELLAALHR